MTFTYNGTPDTNLKRVRFLIQDTDTNSALLTDEEINWQLSVEANIYKAAANLCEVIATRLARIIDRSAMTMSVSSPRTPEFFLELANRLRSSTRIPISVFVGGRSISEKEDLLDREDAVRPPFSIGMDDFPGGNSDPGYSSSSSS